MTKRNDCSEVRCACQMFLVFFSLITEFEIPRFSLSGVSKEETNTGLGDVLHTRHVVHTFFLTWRDSANSRSLVLL